MVVVGFRVCTPAPPVVWVVGFRAECQQLGTARTETVARPGECRRIGHATKLHSLKSHNTHEDPRFGGPIPVTVRTFETKVRPLRGFRALPLGGGGGGVPTRDTRPYMRQCGCSCPLHTRLHNLANLQVPILD